MFSEWYNLSLSNMHIFLCNHTLQCSAISLSHGSKWCLEKTFWWHGQDMLGRSKISPSACHECKYVGWFKLGRNCFSCLLFCWLPPPPPPNPFDFNKFKVSPPLGHHRTYIYIPSGALQSFRKGSQQAKELLCVSTSDVYSSGGAPECFHSACFGDSLSHIFLRRDSFIYICCEKLADLHTGGLPKHAGWFENFQAALFSLDRIFPDVRRHDGGESCWWISSEFAVFSKKQKWNCSAWEREREISLPSSGERALLIATW